WCFFIDGLTYLAALYSLFRLKVSSRPRTPSTNKPMHDIIEGWKYAYKVAPIRSLLLLLAGMSIVGLPYTVLLPVIAKETLRGGANTLGFLMAAAGTGAMTGALVMA